MTAADPEGRVRHLLDVMHKTYDDAGDPIAAGMVPVADGLGQVDYIDSASFGGLPWFNVKDYGAVGDGTTDDRTDINLAIAAYNAAGGVLYFPAATYYVSNALTALTKPGLVLGDGMGPIGSGASVIKTDHATAKLFTVSGTFIEFRGLGMENTATTPASGGAAIATTTGHGAVCTYRNLWIRGFYDGMALQHGGLWAAEDVVVVNPSRYGFWIANADAPDGGDWGMSNCHVTTDSGSTHTPTSAIRQDSAGGGKIVNLKINGDAAHPFVTGYDLNINGSANTTSVATLASSSIENVSGDAILISTTGTGVFNLLTISSLEVGLYGNNSGRAVKISAATHGVYNAAGSIGVCVIDGLVARTDGTARAAVQLVNTDSVTLGEMALSGFNARYTSSGDTNTIDAGAGSSGTVTSVAMTVPAEFAIGGSPITTSGTLAITKANESANTVWAGPTSGGAAAPTFRALVAADVPTITLTEAQVYGVGGHFEILMDPATSSPPVPLTTPDGSDWVYGWISDGG
jgi:hypothetical protein